MKPMKKYLKHPKKRYGIWAIVGIILIFFVALGACTIGTANITLWDSLSILLKEIPVVGKLIPGEYSASHQAIILHLRLPRVVLSILVGAALAVSGAIFQGIFKNPMADPYVLGVSAGAAFGATIAIILGLQAVAGAMGWITLFSFAGAVFTIFTVYILARTKSRLSITGLLLSGIAVSSFITALISALMVLFRNQIEHVVLWTMGSFAGPSWDKVVWSLPFVITGIFVAYFFARDLNILLLGDESAHHLGINIERTKKILLLVGSLTTASAVSVSGIIGFVGLMIPHMVRILVGPDHRILIPFSALAGSLFLVIADTLARVVANPLEIPVGVITAIFGGPFFIYLLRHRKKERF
jgi:iron complex transport system permease protein